VSEDAGPAADGTEADGGVATVPARDAGVDEGSSAGPLGQVAVVAAQEYRLSVRNRWALALTVLFALLSVLVTLSGGSGIGPARVDAVVVSLTSLVTYLVPLAALVFGFDAVVGAEEAGWLDVVFALPVSRSYVVVGTYLGRAVTLAGATAVGFGLAGAVLLVRAGRLEGALFATFLFAAAGVGLAFLSVSVLISTLASEKTHALGGALIAWVWFVFVHDLLALGAVAGLSLPDAALSAFVLANPADLFRVLVLAQVETTGGGLAAVFAGTGLSTPTLAAALAVWCAAPALLAGRLVERRSI
jgi:Cu-processing system permease protein